MPSEHAAHHDDRDGLSEGLRREIARRLWDDRERIAYDLADVLIRRMFAISLDLHSALARIGDEQAARKVRAAITSLDQSINDVRVSVFHPRGDDPPPCDWPRPYPGLANVTNVSCNR